MSKYTGLLTSMTFAGDDISNDITSFTIGSPTNMIDVSGLDVEGFERLAGRKDTNIALSGVVSSDTDGFHANFSPASSAQVNGTLVITFAAGPVYTVSVIANGYEVAVDNSLGLTGRVTLTMFDGTPGVWS
jgi:hypothetical protein